jgi:murein tripeptide amidase MpaA
MRDRPLAHSEIYHNALWFISIFVQGRGTEAQYSPRHTSYQALVDVAVHHHGHITFGGLTSFYL